MRFLLALLLAAPVASSASLEFTRPVGEERYPELGMNLTPPTGFERLPTRPRDRFCVLAYVEKAPRAETPASFEVFLVPRDEGATVNDGTTFMNEVIAPRSHEEQRAGRRRFEYEPKRWHFEQLVEGVTYEGWAHAWENEDRTIVLVGHCATGERSRQERYWARSAETMRLFDAQAQDGVRAKWERYYQGRRDLCGTDRRVATRLDLVEGWSVTDTKHYILLDHGVDPAFVSHMAKAVEAIRTEYAKLCPPDGVLDEVATIRICKDQAEYMAYGGWEGSVGYWSPSEEELVLFDATRSPEFADLGEAFTRSVLFHEAFHQYVYYASGRIAPHPWFDEGMAEYFGGAEMWGTRVRSVGPNPFSLPAMQTILKEGKDYPFELVTGLSQKELYADPQTLYPQSWSMVHFLATSPDVRSRRQWSGILETYFRTLRSAWASERLTLAGGGNYADAQQRARRAAQKAAFKDVDFVPLEEAWRRHVNGLSAPDAK